MPMMKCACVTIYSFCVLPLFFVCHICQKPNRSLSSSSSFVTNAFKFDHSQCQPVSQSVSHSRSQSIVQLYLKYQFMHGNYSGFFILFCFTRYIQQQHPAFSDSISHLFHSLDRALTQNNSEIFTVLFLCVVLLFIALAAPFFLRIILLIFLSFHILSERCSDIHQEMRFSGRLNSTLSWLCNYVL